MNQEAVYQPKPWKDLESNPLIAALPDPLSAKELVGATSCRLTVPDDIMGQDSFYRKLFITKMKETYLPDPEFLPLYESLMAELYSGYMHRCPFSAELKSLRYRVATDPSFQPAVGEIINTAILLIGLSGRGKTLAVRRALSLLPQVIRHTEFKATPFVHDQLVYVCVEMAGANKQKGFIQNFFAAVDIALGTDYFKEYVNSTSNVSKMLRNAQLVTLKHSIGIIFVDEIQRCVSSNSTADWTTLNFIESVFSAIKIPVICAGTYGAAPLFDTSLSTTRRLSSGRSFNFSAHDQKSDYWRRLVMSFYYPGILKKDFHFDETFIATAHELSQGLPAILSRLMIRSYEYAIESRHEALDVNFLMQVFELQFKALKPALNALRSGRLDEFEDLCPPRGYDWEFTKSTRQSLSSNKPKSRSAEASEKFYILDDDNRQTLETKNDLRQLHGGSKETIHKALSDARRGRS